MQISNIDCCKPRRKYLNFTSSEPSGNNRPRFKHYEELTDEALRLRSVIKAHDEVKNGGKVRVLKALPAITAGLIGTSIAITQPGKLSAKAGAGLGFLALLKASASVSNFTFNAIDKKEAHAKENKKEMSPIAKLLGTIAIAGAGVLAIRTGAKHLPKLIEKHAKPVSDFVKKDIEKFASEVNQSRLGTFVEDKLNPFLNKHKKAVSVASVAVPIGIFGGVLTAKGSLEKGISKDIKEKTQQNYVKGKIIQTVARNEFDKIDAIEV